MAIDRTLWLTTHFTEDTFRNLPCPVCITGALKLDKKTLASGETDASVQAVQEADYDIEWTEGRFSCLLRCQSCSEAVAVAGSYSIAQWLREEGTRHEQTFMPSIFVSAPNIFAIPTQVPPEIAKEVRKAFELYWTDPSASGNRIRVSIELLLTHLDVPRYTINSRHKREPLALGNRIDKLKSRNPVLGAQFAEALNAIRHLGNAGSHPGGLTREDVLDAMEIQDHIFQELFVQHRKRIGKITKEIVRKKGPR